MTTATKLRFKSNRTFINSKFDGYKLQVFPDATNVHRFALPEPLSLPKVAMNSKISYRELQARVKFNHLCASHRKGLSFYVDNAYAVISVEYDDVAKRVRYHRLAQLQVPITDVPGYTEPDSSISLLPQYPSLVSLSPDMLLASNGMGVVHVIRFDKDLSGEMAGSIVSIANFLGDGSEGLSPVPCVLRAAKLVDNIVHIITWSVASQQNQVPSHPSPDAPTSKTLFNLSYLKLPIDDAKAAPATDLILQHMHRGRDIPFYCEFDRTASGYLVGSTHAYDLVHNNQDTEMEDEAMNEVVGDTKEPAASLYRWVQSSDDLTIVFQLPPNTAKAAISCSFDVRHLSLIVGNGDNILISLPFRKLWDVIDSESSTWTVESSSGLLTLELAKKHESVRWPHVFELDDGVHEDLNAEQLEEIRSRLDKFTGEDDEKAAAMGVPGWKQPLQHPIATDMDEDIDHDGQSISLWWIDGATGKVGAEVSAGGQEWISTSFSQPASDDFPTVCLKMDVDGLVYAIERASPIDVKHIASFNALAFVQASKRDQRFIHHDAANTFSIILEGSRNAYIYFRHDNGKQQTDIQTLVDLTEGHDIDVIGAQLVDDRIVMVLLESSIVLLDLRY